MIVPAGAGRSSMCEPTRWRPAAVMRGVLVDHDDAESMVTPYRC